MKRMLSLLLALALCGALVGCGGQDSSSSSGGPVSSAPGIYMPRMLMVDGAVSYTHLTLPTKVLV